MTDSTRVVVPPDHPVTFLLTDKATGLVVDVSETTAELIGGHYTTLRIIWNALAVSGGSRWRHPTNGDYYPRGLSVRVEMVNPDTGETVGVEI